MPIYWFGDEQASVATVAINPGPDEFTLGAEKEGYWGQRHEFGVHRKDYKTSELDQIAKHCSNYFAAGRSGDKFWSRLENLLSLGGASYGRKDAVRACHVDLVPWATGPVWSGLIAKQKQSLLAASADARKDLFASLPARVLVCRGATATRAVGQALGFFSGEPQWQLVSGKGYVAIVKCGDRWLLGTRDWDFDQTVGSAIGEALEAALRGEEPRLQPRLTAYTQPIAGSKSPPVRHTFEEFLALMQTALADTANDHYWNDFHGHRCWRKETFALSPSGQQMVIGTQTRADNLLKFLELMNNPAKQANWPDPIDKHVRYHGPSDGRIRGVYLYYESFR